MAENSNPQSMQKTDAIVGNLLRAGVTLSGGIVLCGGMLYLFRHGTDAPVYRVFRGEPADLRSLRGIFHDVLSLRGRGLIQFGLLLLIATPVARVAFLAYAFARQGDRFYTLVALIVLALLALSLAGGKL